MSRTRPRERVGEATGLALRAAAAGREDLVGLAFDELIAMSGGERGMRAADDRLREAVSASSEPALQRAGAGRPGFPQLARGRRRNGDADDVDADDLAERDFSTEQRRRLAKRGAALPDGSFPIVTGEDLANATRAVGRARPSDRPAVRRHIRKRAKQLGLTDQLPDSWREADDDQDRDDDERELDEQIENLGSRRAPAFRGRHEADLDDDADEDADQDEADDSDEEDDDREEPSLADRLARAGRRRGARRESADILDRTIGSRPLRETGGSYIDILDAMRLERGV